jgi:UPF0716 protein FxsA
MPPVRLLLLAAFIIIPLIEIVLLIKVGGAIGVLATVFIVIATAVVGTSLLHRQGFGVLARANEAMNSGKVPLESVIEGVFLLIAGAFLLTPGLLTDTFGFLLLVPPVRRAMAAWSLKKLMASGSVSGGVFTSGPAGGETGDDWPGAERGRPKGWVRGAGQRRPRNSAPDIIEGDYERVDERTVSPSRDNNRGEAREGRRDDEDS